jgi:hypothetical protein
MSEYQPYEWERPLSAQVAGNAEVMFVEVAGHEPSAEDPTPGYLPLEAMPGVRDVDRVAGLVRTEEGRTVSIAQFLGHGGLRSSLER